MADMDIVALAIIVPMCFGLLGLVIVDEWRHG